MDLSPYTDLERPPLDARALRRSLGGEGQLWREIRLVQRTGSTNADVAALARAGAAEGVVLIAEYQTAGRGRHGRGWTQPPRSGLSFSLLLRPAVVPLTRWPLLPLLLGLAIADAVRHVAEIDVGLKWPNDLLVGERKLGGVLTERVDSPRGPAVVAGVGLNVTLREGEAPIADATSLELEGAACLDRQTLLVACLRTLDAAYAAWYGNGGDGERRLLPAYRERCVTLGREVAVHLPGGGQTRGTAVDIDDAGRLVVDFDGGRRALSAGEVVHVR